MAPSQRQDNTGFAYDNLQCKTLEVTSISHADYATLRDYDCADCAVTILHYTRGIVVCSDLCCRHALWYSHVIGVVPRRNFSSALDTTKQRRTTDAMQRIRSTGLRTANSLREFNPQTERTSRNLRILVSSTYYGKLCSPRTRLHAPQHIGLVSPKDHRTSELKSRPCGLVV